MTKLRALRRLLRWRAGARTARGLLLALAGATLLEASQAPGLPPVDCVETLRRVRLEANSQLRHEMLIGALDLPGCELAALTELSRMAARGLLPEAEGRELWKRLIRLVEDPAVRLPNGVLSVLSLNQVAPEEDALLAETLARRITAAQAGGLPIAGPEWIEVLSTQLRIELRLDRPEAARAIVEQLMRIDAAAGWEWIAIELDYRLERWEPLAENLARLMMAPAAVEVLDDLYIETMARLGRYDDIAAHIGRILPEPPAGEAIDPVRAQLEAGRLLDIAWILRDAGRDQDAERLFRRALALNPDSKQARGALLYLYGEDAERAGHTTALAESWRTEEDPGALYEEGTQRLAAGDAAGSRDLLARAAPGLADGPLAEAAWYNLGLAAWRLEDWVLAADAFGQAATFNPNRPETHFQLGMALYRLERWLEAAEALERALALQPSKSEARYYLAVCLQALGRDADAERERELYRSSLPPG